MGFLGTKMSKKKILVHIYIIPNVKKLKHAIVVFQPIWLLIIRDTILLLVTSGDMDSRYYVALINKIRFYLKLNQRNDIICKQNY
jgi:hypothetical protein